ncbi:ABC transporter permease subunit [Xylophilus rhododendri]|uniref:ABC transporter permease subunit n=2 Tax=Xylophilus rhododendri TaxID=2697032 RepID=A0A857JEW3_9BURK|nr:ABC transporter permease subunit [Xylophilus rhododendri]
MIPVALVIIVMNFFLLKAAPGDMADVIAGEAGAATPEFMAALRGQFGIDQPLPVQFGHYLRKIASLNLGWSFRANESVMHLIWGRLPATALLVVSALLVALVIGTSLGAWAALTRRRWVEPVVSLFTTIGFATPLFWVGLMLIVLFSVKLGWLPTGGLSDITIDLQGPAHWLDAARHLVLPGACLSLYYLAVYARLMRASVLEVDRLDFVRTATAKGLSRWRVVLRHIVPNAMLSIVTMTGLQFGALLAGSITIETVFAWPGLGQLALYAVTSRDVNLLLGILLFSSFFVMLVNLLTDLLYSRLDPRIGELGGRA